MPVPRDGFVDRHFNRRCSRLLTRLFLRTSLTPNAITMIAFTIGLGAAALLATGGWTAGVLGALLLQLSVVVDCCDGEVARARRLQSALGETLDVIADNVVHVAIVVAIAWAAHRATGDSAPLVLGALAAAGMGIDFAVVRRLRGQPARSRLADRLVATAANRDFSVLIVVLALVDRLSWMVWLAAIGSHVFWLLLVPVPESPRRAEVERG